MQFDQFAVTSRNAHLITRSQGSTSTSTATVRRAAALSSHTPASSASWLLAHLILADRRRPPLAARRPPPAAVARTLARSHARTHTGRSDPCILPGRLTSSRARPSRGRLPRRPSPCMFSRHVHSMQRIGSHAPSSRDVRSPRPATNRPLPSRPSARGSSSITA
jgi:hypothetical protein